MPRRMVWSSCILAGGVFGMALVCGVNKFGPYPGIERWGYGFSRRIATSDATVKARATSEQAVVDHIRAQGECPQDEQSDCRHKWPDPKYQAPVVGRPVRVKVADVWRHIGLIPPFGKIFSAILVAFFGNRSITAVPARVPWSCDIYCTNNPNAAPWDADRVPF